MNEHPCKLCGKHAKLANSHIIPEFCYKPVYDDLHRLNEISTDPTVPNRRVRQKGVRERLLCNDCEQRISSLEKYVREILYGGTEIEIVEEPLCLRLSSLDYTKLKLFQLSVLWRASVSRESFFQDVNVGDYHERRIRSMIERGDPGPETDYGCVMNVLEVNRPSNPVLDGFLKRPEKVKLYDHRAYRFMFAGIAWFFVVSSHSDRFPDKKLFATETGCLILPKVDAKRTEYFRHLTHHLKQTNKLTQI